MPKELDTANLLLNKLWAMRTIKLLTLGQIAKELKVNERSVSDWLTQRRRTPSGDVLFRLQSFAAKMTLNISRKPALAVKYRAAFAAANVLFPVTPVEGSEK